MKLGVRSLWLIIVICNTIDLLYSYELWTGYIAITGGFIELNPLVNLIETIGGNYVFPDSISLKNYRISRYVLDNKIIAIPFENVSA